MVVSPLKKVRLLHERLKQTSEDQIDIIPARNPYQLLYDWIKDVITFGFLCFLFSLPFFGWKGIVKSIFIVIGFGVLPTIIKELKELIKP